MVMRDEFERWAEKYSEDLDLSRGNHGSYKSLMTHHLYCAWVASREAIAKALA